ncbi:MAG: CotH kinase family protein [Opitutaceae bacterium]
MVFPMAVMGLRAEPLITEFMAANSSTLADEDGTFSDWVEIHNSDATAVNFSGWHLTDSAGNKSKWQMPEVTLAPGGYLLVFASNKDRRDSNTPVHASFALSADGEYLGLIKPDGTVASEYAPKYPSQSDDVSFGLPPQGGGFGPAGFLSRPTPGAANAPASAASPVETVIFSREPGPFRDAFLLELSGAGANGRIRYVVAPSSAAADAAAPTATSPEYTGPFNIDSSLLVRAAVFSADGSSHGPVTNAYYAKFASSLGNFASQLPVMVIDSLGTGELFKDGVDHLSWFYLYEAQGIAPTFSATPEVVSQMTMTVRGSSSAGFPKRGYNVEFMNAQGKKNAQALLDLPAHEKWALVAPWSFDMGYINNPVVYGLSNELGRWAPQTRFAEVFFNANGGEIDASDYVGIYVITDRIEIGEDRVDIKSLSPSDVSGTAVTGGYILKIDYQEEDDFGWMTSKLPEFGDSSVILVAPKADDIAPAQLDYIKNYVQQMEDALFADQAKAFGHRTYLDYIDRDSWIDYHLLSTFVCNPDAFTRSTYFTKPRNGKLVAGPVWDFDRAMGSYWDERSYRWDVWFGVGGPDYWRTGWWGVIAQDPEFMQEWIDRWQSLRRDELSDKNLAALVNGLGGQIGADAANRDGSRWPDSRNPFGSYDGQIAFLRGWMTLRAGWIDEQFLAPPQVSVSGESLVISAPAGAQLAYTLDGSDPRSLGGEIAPDAILTGSQLTVPASSNLHVRSYRADLRGVFPGSPWSSAVGGESSSPLTPRARIVNISSRAMVGTGENALIAGVVIADTVGKRYLSRAVGPGLAAFGASGIVPDPQLSIFGGNGVELFRNNAWETGTDAAQLPGYSKSVGAFPLAPGSKDSALADDMAAGSYTVQITTPGDQPGIGLAELYELDGRGRTVNLSTRARVRTGDGVLIGGFVVQGPAYKRMLIRAVGPALSAFGLGDALLDPILTIHSGQQVVASNDRWEAAQNAAAVVAASRTAGAFTLAANSEDAAILITLPPGAYTIEVKGKADSEGVALLEIYEVP